MFFRYVFQLQNPARVGNRQRSRLDRNKKERKRLVTDRGFAASTREPRPPKKDQNETTLSR